MVLPRSSNTYFKFFLQLYVGASVHFFLGLFSFLLIGCRFGLYSRVSGLQDSGEIELLVGAIAKGNAEWGHRGICEEKRQNGIGSWLVYQLAKGGFGRNLKQHVYFEKISPVPCNCNQAKQFEAGVPSIN